MSNPTRAALAACVSTAMLVAAPSIADAQALTFSGERSVAVRSPAIELQRNRSGEIDARRLLPAGTLVNAGEAPVRAVVWLEPRDERRGFAIFSPRRSAQAPRSARPIAVGEISPGGRLSFGSFRMIEIDGIDGESITGRLILALESSAPLAVRGEVRAPRTGWRFADLDEEEVQMVGTGVFFPTDVFSPERSFFPTEIFSPRR